MIHRAIFGSFERFIALLIEHYAGRVPDVAGAGAGDRAADCRSAPASTRGGPRAAGHAGGFAPTWTSGRRRSVIRFREAQMQKIPYMLVVGDREAAEGTVGVRHRAGWGSGGTGAQFIEAALEEGAPAVGAGPADEPAA